MTEKSFVTCFDKDFKECAELLMTLISQNESICNINRKTEEFNKDCAVTSSEYVLTIGPNGSKVNRSNFPDCYNKYGIHIGFRGRKAWICCEDYNWNKEKVKEFRKELIQLLDELGMRIDNIDEEIEENIKKAKVAKTTAVVSTGSLAGNVIMESIISTSTTLFSIPKSIAMAFTLLYYIFRELIEDLMNKQKIRDQQYKLAVVLFYHKYINEFLNINASKEDVDKDKRMDF